MKKYEDAIQKKEVLPNIKIENIFGIEQIADSKTKQYPVTASDEPNHQQAVYNMFDRVFKFELTLDEYHAIQEKLFALFKEYYDLVVPQIC